MSPSDSFLIFRSFFKHTLMIGSIYFVELGENTYLPKSCLSNFGRYISEHIKITENKKLGKKTHWIATQFFYFFAIFTCADRSSKCAQEMVKRLKTDRRVAPPHLLSPWYAKVPLCHLTCLLNTNFQAFEFQILEVNLPSIFIKGNYGNLGHQN